MGQPMRREDRCHVPRLLSSVHELHIRKPQPWEKRMGPALSRGLKQNGAVGRRGRDKAMSGVELPAYSPDWKFGRGGAKEEEEESLKIMPTWCAISLENVSDRGAEETVGLRWTASGARARRAVYFRSCFGDTAVGRGCQDASIRREKPTFAPQIASMPLSMTTSLY